MSFRKKNILCRIYFVLLLLLGITGCHIREEAEQNTVLLDSNNPFSGKIAFLHIDQLSKSENIFIADENDLRELSTNLKNIMDLAWHPNGKSIIFSASVEGYNQIYTVDIKNTNITQLTYGQTSSYSPSWSPDGKYIIFLSQHVSNQSMNDAPIQSGYVMESNGMKQYLFTEKFGFVKSVSWYGNSNLISLSVPESRYTLKVTLVDVNGVRQSEFPEKIIGGMPNWSLDGEAIVYTPFIASSNCSNIIVYEGDSLEQECLVIDTLSPPTLNKMPSWGPGNEYLFLLQM